MSLVVTDPAPRHVPLGARQGTARQAATDARVAAARGPAAGSIVRVSGGLGGIQVATEALHHAANVLDQVAQVLLDEQERIVRADVGVALSHARQLDPAGALATDDAFRRAMVGAASLPRSITELGRLALALRAAVGIYEVAEAAVHELWAGLVMGVGSSGSAVLLRRALRHELPKTVPALLALGAGIEGATATGEDAHPGFLGRVVGPAIQVLVSPAEAQVVLQLSASILGGPGSGMRGGARAMTHVARAQGLFGGTRTAVSQVTQASVDADAAWGIGEGGRLRLPTTMATGTGGLLRMADVMSTGPGAGDPHRDGRVLVQRIVRNGKREVIVSIPGTRTWTSGHADPMDLQSNIESIAGERTAAEDAVERALVAAGVGRDEPMLLIGHSQGGLTASGLAADPAFRAKFHPVAVLTAGSPVAGDELPARVDALRLEHDDDLVTSLDGAKNPDSAAHLTVVASTPPGNGTHFGYERTGDLVGTSKDASLGGWREVIAPFVSDGSASAADAEVTTTLWSARRVETVAG